MRPRHACCLILLGLALTPALAHWDDHKELPDWARRGYCQWGHGANVDGKIKWGANGFGVDVPNARLLLYCDRNLMQTISYLSPEAKAIGEGAGIKRQPYICSKTIWWRSELPKAPQLEKCLVLKKDGSKVLLYNNPERYGGCYSSPIWLEYMKGRIDALMADQSMGQVHSIFFDNASNYDCYCPDCQAQFRAYTQQKFGVEMDLLREKDFPNWTFARQMFDADTVVRFFKNIKQYLDTKYGPGILVSPNIGIAYGWSGYLVNQGATDLVMIEEGFTFPPIDSTVLKYKLGLAASHGLTTGQLLGLAETLRRKRALILDPNNEMGIQESFMYPEEHKLALAEAMATGGTCQVSFALREQKITANNEPYQVQNREAIHQYAEFARQHLPLFDLAQPGAKVAMVYPIITECGLRSGHQQLPRVAAALQKMGLPYEVLIEEDLTPEQLRGVTVLIMPEVRCLNLDRCRALEQWLAHGGVLVQMGALAQANELNQPYPEGQAPQIGKMTTGEPQRLGQGYTWRPAKGLDEMPVADVLAQLQRLAGPLECVSGGAKGKLFASILQSHDGKTRMVHLTNSDIKYDLPPVAGIGDDDGAAEARTFLSSTTARVKKVLVVPDPAQVQGMDLKCTIATCGMASDAFSLVVTLNGQDIATYPGSKLNDKPELAVPIPAGVLRQGENEIILRTDGKPSGHPDWVAFRIDTSATSRRSWWSDDRGQTWTQDDLGLDPGPQPGEVMVRLGPAEDPNKVATVADFMGKLHVQPAKNVEVVLQAGLTPPAATWETPEGARQKVTPQARGGMAVYRVPEFALYGMLTLPR